MTNRFTFAMRKTSAATRALNPWAATRLIQAALSRNSALGQSLQFRPPATAAPASTDRAALDTAQGAFTTRSLRCAAGTREYKLYVPDTDGQPLRGLVIMLHGCTQNPEDFAAGTRMNEVAERERLIVAYPSQTRANNPSGCWNWFQTADQHRDKGEPAILAGIARELSGEFAFTREQVFIAGLSAGGAMAVIMAETYPDVFSGVGVHSGLPYQSAGNVMTALTAMRGRAHKPGNAPQDAASIAPLVRTIVFHGSADKTVHPSNATGIVDSVKTPATGLETVTETGAANGKRFTRTIMSG